MVYLAIGAFWIGYWLIEVDMPILLGRTIIDARDPDHPGRLKAISVFPFPSLFHLAAFIGCVYLVARFWKHRRIDDSTMASGLGLN